MTGHQRRQHIPRRAAASGANSFSSATGAPRWSHIQVQPVHLVGGGPPVAGHLQLEHLLAYPAAGQAG